MESIHLDTHQSAQFLGISPKTLERWRIEGEGPAFRKLGRRVVYARAELERWAAEQETHRTDPLRRAG